MRRMIALCMAACMALSLTACGSKDAPSGSAGQGSQSSSASQQETVTVPPVEDLTGVNTSSIPGLEDGVLTVGMECAYAPYNWLQPDDSNGAVPVSGGSGYANGYDVMIAKRICEAYGW